MQRACNLFWRVLLLWGLICGGLPAAARDIAISTPAALYHALDSAQAGDRLVLAPGEYGSLMLSPHKDHGRARFDGRVTLISADPTRPAVFTKLVLKQARNLVFDQILFDYRASAGSHRESPFKIESSADITIRRSRFDGDNAHGAGPEADGFGAGRGLRVRHSQRVTIESSQFYNFYRGLIMGRGQDHIVRGNAFWGMRSDGMNVIKSQRILIENNYFHDFRRNMAAGDHADMIQFWTNGAKTPITDITIRGNVFNIGHGDHTQTIFMRNEAVDSQNGGKAMFYRNIRIEENVIINGHSHGISIGESNGLIIANNTLIRAPRKTADTSGRGSPRWVPRIRVADASVNVQIRNNIAPALRNPQPNWHVSGNLVIQDAARMQSGHYTRVFQNGLATAPYALENFIYRPDGVVAAGQGAARLRSAAALQRP